MPAIRLVLNKLIWFTATIGTICIFVEVCVIVVDVVGRFFGYPLFGSQDIITMVMVVVVASGLVSCDNQNGHIVVDLLKDRFSENLNRKLDVISALLGSAIFIAIAWTVWESSEISLMLNLKSNLLSLPKAWFQWALCVLALLTAFNMIMRVLEMAVREQVAK